MCIQSLTLYITFDNIKNKKYTISKQILCSASERNNNYHQNVDFMKQQFK